MSSSLVIRGMESFTTRDRNLGERNLFLQSSQSSLRYSQKPEGDLRGFRGFISGRELAQKPVDCLLQLQLLH